MISTVSSSLPGAEISRLIDVQAQRFLQLWKVDRLLNRVRIEFSSRMTRSLGRCFPDRRMIRLHEGLLNLARSGHPEHLEEVLCHELAHLVAFQCCGRNIRPHGSEWQNLVRQAGYIPSTRLNVPLPNRPAQRKPNRWVEHRCPVCRIFRLARRRVNRWRCMHCLSAGRSGRLSIKPLPESPKSPQKVGGSSRR